MKLQHLEIKSFRGATKSVKIDFDPEKNTTMIFGENGNGKSTISDALVCLLSEELGSLDDRSTDKKSSYLVSTECKMKEVFIKLATDAGDFTATLSASGKAVKQPPTGYPNVRQLRRSHITRLIDAQPAKRYEELRAYIDVSKIEASEDKLRELEKELKRTFDSQTNVLASAQETLNQLWEAEQKPGTDYMSWAANEKAKDLKTEETKRNELKEILNCWEKLDSSVSDVKSKSANVTTTGEELSQAVTLLEAEQGGGEGDQQLLIALLQKTQSYLAGQSTVEHCPVCSQDVQKDELSKSITERLSRMSTISKLMSGRDAKQNQFDAANTLLNNAYQNMDACLAAFIKSVLGSSVELDQQLSTIASEMNVTDLEAVRQSYKKNVAFLRTSISRLTTALQKVEKTLSQYNSVTIQYDTIIANETKTKETAELLVKTTATLETVMKCRQKFVEDELDSIAGEVDRIYKILHPNESIGGVKLSLKPGAKASLELSADFHSKKGINPQSLYSESHLDTLGICIFLALANKYNDGDTILILDDVVMSVDHSHLDRFIDLINQEASKFTHVLLTTHYRPWKDRYKHHRAGSGAMHFVELKPWTLKTGISIQSFKMDYTDLKTALDNTEFDGQVIAGKAGIFLENMLDFLAGKFRCRLPYASNAKYTLGDYLTCFNNKLLNALQVHHLTKDQTTGKYVEDTTMVQTPLKDIIEKLRSMAFIRNEIGAHFNLDSQVSDTEVKDFGEVTLKLANLLICPDDGSLPIKERLGSFWATPTGSIKLLPLKEPI